MSETKAPEVAGRIMPRKSWPRRATPTDLVPAWAGEFRDYEDWVSKATNRLTGTYDPMMGNEVPAICIDAFGRRCTLGGHFRRAMEEGAFPVRFFWDCEPPSRAEESADQPAHVVPFGRRPSANDRILERIQGVPVKEGPDGDPADPNVRASGSAVYPTREAVARLIDPEGWFAAVLMPDTQHWIAGYTTTQLAPTPALAMLAALLFALNEGAGDVGSANLNHEG